MWPSENPGASSYNFRNRSLDCADINMEPRHKTRAASYQPPVGFIAGVSKNHSPVQRNEEGKPYKNGSTVFSHLVDEPSVRQKINYGGKPPINSASLRQRVQKTVPGQSQREQ